MANARPIEATKIVQDRILKLEADSKSVIYGVVLVEGDMLLVIDFDGCTIQIYNRHDGKQMYPPHRLQSHPIGVCLISSTEVAVCLINGNIAILFLKSMYGIQRVKILNIKTRFGFECHSVASYNSDKLLVSGRNIDMLCWLVLSIKDGRIDSNHDICKLEGVSYGSTRLATHDATVYISLWTQGTITKSCVYAFDIFMPRKPKFLYQHEELKSPRSIMVVMGYVYVCDRYSIHQLTDSGQLVTIHKMSSNIHEIFYDDQHRVLYTVTPKSKDITVYKMEYPHQAGIPVEILSMDDRSIKLFEDALKEGKETVYSIRIMVVGHMGVGKTTLVKRLLGDEVNISKTCSTEGIDVYVNFCDISLLNKEWMQRDKDSVQDYKLQRLVKLLNENYKTSSSAEDQEKEKSGDVVADYGKNTKMQYQLSQKRIGLESTDSNQAVSPSTEVQRNYSKKKKKKKKAVSSSTDVQRNYSKPEKEMMPIEIHASHKKDLLREMLKVLNENRYKVKQYVKRYADLSIWDFAGQYAFYSTHQMFLSRRAIYLMVEDVSGQIDGIVEDEFYLDTEGKVNCKANELVEIWINSIHSCAPSDTENLNSASTSSYTVIPPPVILVGTHVDQIKKSNRYEFGREYLRKIRSYLKDKPAVFHLVKEDFALDNSIVDSRLEELKRKIVEVASQQPYWGEEIPTRWFLLEQQLMSLRDAGVKHYDVGITCCEALLYHPTTARVQ